MTSDLTSDLHSNQHSIQQNPTILLHTSLWLGAENCFKSILWNPILKVIKSEIIASRQGHSWSGGCNLYVVVQVFAPLDRSSFDKASHAEVGIAYEKWQPTVSLLK